MQITEELFNSLGKGWKNISIRQEGDNYVLALIFETKEQSDTFLHIIKVNKFTLKVTIDEEKKYNLMFIFGDDEPVFGIKINRTKEDYIPLGWLEQAKINFITTGIWISAMDSKINQSYYPVVNNISFN